MNKYYYFVASLPTLNLDSNPPMNIEEFLAGCKMQLTSADNALITALMQGQEPSGLRNSTSRRWSDFNHAFKNQIAFSRAKKQGKPTEEHVRGEYLLDVEIENIVNEALKQEDLLMAEKVIDKKRWDFLDDMGQVHFFDMANVIIYGLKLQILEKYKKISSDEGHKLLEAYQSIDKIKGVTSERQ